MQYLFTWLIVYGFPQKYMTLKAAGYCAAYKCEFQTSSITQAITACSDVYTYM